jgi:multiple sugar transport system permease protein
LASSPNPLNLDNGGPAEASGLTSSITRRATQSLGALRSDGALRWLFMWPAVLLIFALSVFPLIAAVVLSVSKLIFAKGAINLDFIGAFNYNQLLFGTERVHFLGLLKDPNPLGWALLIVAAGWVAYAWIGLVRSHAPLRVLILRAVGGVALLIFVWYVAQTLLSNGGRPGSVLVTVIFVAGGITLQYALGLGLALLATVAVPGRRLFRVLFLIPLTITPVGIGYMWRMLTDTSKGPFEPLLVGLGLRNWTWVNDPWSARLAVIIGDTWQWTPFVFIVLLAALEGLDQESREAALVDGANRLQVFRHITLPAILPVSATIVLIRLIEGFKIVDMPAILLGGGPGTATQSMTYQAYLDWNTLNLGRSAAVALMLMVFVSIVATVYVAIVRRRAYAA